MSKHETTITVNRPPGKIFDLLLDLKRWGEWQQGHIEARQISEGALGVGATIRQKVWIIPPIKATAVYRVTACEPGKWFEIETIKSPVQAKIWWQLEPMESGTRVTLSNETVSRGLFKWFERVFPTMGQQLVEREAQKLKTFVETS